MLPTLKEFGIMPPVFIRKIDSRGRWNPEDCRTVEDRAKRVADSLFREEVYSLWLVTSDLDFYGIVASLSARRTPKHQDIDFIWITEEELKEVGIVPKPESEGACLNVQSLHFNAQITSDEATKLCYNIMLKKRDAQRCKKKATTLILEYKEQMGCKAIRNDSLQCRCELK